jgi:hypothetical protein
MKKWTLYFNGEKMIFAALEGEAILERVVVEAETIEEAFKKFNPKIFEQQQQEGQVEQQQQEGDKE